jgi:outer membrane lipoprotein carrier protein
MKYPRFQRLCASFVPGLLLLLPISAATQDGRHIVEKVKARLDKIESLSCSFQREHVWNAAGRTQNIAGKLQLRKPYRLRVEYPAQTIVVDGKTAWTYVPRNKQVTITKFKQSDAEYPSPQSIFRRYSGRKSEVTGQESVAGRSADILHLIPSAPSETDVVVWIDREMNFPIKSVETTPNGDITTSILTNVVINGKIEDSVFTFSVPEGVRTVDMRK